MGSCCGPKQEKINGFDKWEIENNLDSLIKAREILKDPKRVAAIRTLAKKRKDAAAEVEAQLEHKVSKAMKEIF